MGIASCPDHFFALLRVSGVKPLTQMLWASSVRLILQEGKTGAGGLAVWF